MSVCPKLCAVSIDLDGVGEYRGLHGLSARERGRHAVIDVALPRARSFARSLRAPLTLFAIGRDLERARSAEALFHAARAGALVENHSFSHRYDLSRQPLDVITDEVTRASERIVAVTDRRPRGFRAPGYLLSAGVLEALRTDGMLYDASSFPCPAYYLTKLAALAAMRARGRASRAIIDDFRPQLAPRQPYERGGLVEIPMAVTRRLRLPVIGTSLALAGARGARALLGGCVGDPVVSLELHGVDFLDASDGLDDLVPHQWDVRLRVSRKLAAFAAALTGLASAGYRFTTLEEVAHASRA